MTNSSLPPTQVLHLIYVHGFRGDHTSFQSFPTDLYNYVEPVLPKTIELRSYLFPTYKSVRPIGEATLKLLTWLRAQPPGLVILFAHSMGGLLTAEAVVLLAQLGGSHVDPAHKVIGVVNFDVPFLGMHPHVVVSGIASLFPKKEGAGGGTEKQMNNLEQVKMVGRHEVDGGGSSDMLSVTSTAVNSSRTSLASHTSPSPSPSPTPSPLQSPTPHAIYPTTNATVNKALTTLNKLSNDPLVKWFRKHTDDPISALKRWVVEHFEFGVCMFEPRDLRDRYRGLERWKGRWVNYWTEVEVKKEHDKGVAERQEMEKMPSNTADFGALADESGSSSRSLSHSGHGSELHVSPPTESKAEPEPEKERPKKQKAKKKEKDKKSHSHHFIVLPHGLEFVQIGSGEKWEKVRVDGAADEVEAHVGLFMKDKNLTYDAFVGRVGDLVVWWVAEDAEIS